MQDVKNILPAFRNKLKYIYEDETQSLPEREAARFYDSLLKNYSFRDLIPQHGFARGVGGSGDNIIVMPLIERDENGQILFEDEKIKTTHCMFRSFKSYLDYITQRKPVCHGHECWMSLPANIDGLPRDVYEAIWFRHQGIVRDNFLDRF